MVELDSNGQLPPLTTPKSPAAALEAPLKRALFGCRSCGQCVLSQTKYNCPMQCPKGLRNGPCGGMHNGFCEVFKERACVWTKIVSSLDARQFSQTLRPALDFRLFGTSSWLNYLRALDTSRIPVNLKESTAAQAKCSSRLYSALSSGAFVITSELRTPREGSLAQLKRRLAEVAVLADCVEAFSATSHPGAMSPETFCKALACEGVETILPLVGRDRKPEQFNAEWRGELVAARAGAVLCLTGDFVAEAPFPMDAAQILFALTRLAADGSSPLRLAALHVKAEHEAVVLARARQKVLAGAELFITQTLTGDEALEGFLTRLRATESLEAVPVMLGVPLIGSLTGLRSLQGLPGLSHQNSLSERFAGSADVRATGLKLAGELVQQAKSLRALGVVGIHVMPFGSAPAETAAFIKSVNSDKASTVSAEELEKVRS